MGTSGLGMVHKLYDIYLYLVTSINVFCALGLCFRVLLLKILQTKRFSCGEILLKTHKQRLQKKKKTKKHRMLYTGLSAVSTVLSWKRVDMVTDWELVHKLYNIHLYLVQDQRRQHVACAFAVTCRQNRNGILLFKKN